MLLLIGAFEKVITARFGEFTYLYVEHVENSLGTLIFYHCFNIKIVFCSWLETKNVFKYAQ